MAVPLPTDAGLRTAMVGLGAVVALVGFCTWSLNKALITYTFGVVAIVGVALPDWEFFDRGFLQWTTLLPLASGRDSEQIADAPRLRMYPLRVAAYSLVYGFGLYKWWQCMID